MQATTANFCLPAQYADEINFRLSLCDTLHYQADSQALHIPYINLEGQPYRTSRNLSFERKRIYAPTQIPKAKYLSPSKAVAGNYYTPLYYPKALRTDFSKKQLRRHSTS